MAFWNLPFCEVFYRPEHTKCLCLNLASQCHIVMPDRQYSDFAPNCFPLVEPRKPFAVFGSFFQDRQFLVDFSPFYVLSQVDFRIPHHRSNQSQHLPKSCLLKKRHCLAWGQLVVQKNCANFWCHVYLLPNYSLFYVL